MVQKFYCSLIILKCKAQSLHIYEEIMMLKKNFFFLKKTKQIYQHGLQIERQAGTCLTAEERPPRRPARALPSSSLRLQAGAAMRHATARWQLLPIYNPLPGLRPCGPGMSEKGFKRHLLLNDGYSLAKDAHREVALRACPPCITSPCPRPRVR